MRGRKQLSELGEGLRLWSRVKRELNTRAVSVAARLVEARTASTMA